MGYYSQVALYIKKEDAVALITKAIERTKTVANTDCLPIVISGCGKIADNDVPYPERVNTWIKQAEALTKEIEDSPKEKTLFLWNFIEWRCDDVEHFIKPFYQGLEYYEFLRVGEEIGDIDQSDRNGEFSFYVRQSIVIADDIHLWKFEK